MARLSHLFLLTSDLERTRRFFTEALGLLVTVDEPGYIRVEGDGGFHIGIEQGDPDGRRMSIFQRTDRSD